MLMKSEKSTKRNMFPLLSVVYKKWISFKVWWRFKGQVQPSSIINYIDNFRMGKGSASNDRCWFNARYGIFIGKNTLIGPNVLIQTVDHVIKDFNIEQNSQRRNRVEGKKVVIGDDVWIGANVLILKGSFIPDKCVVGAGTLITEKNCRDLKPGDIVVNDIKLRKLSNRKNYLEKK